MDTTLETGIYQKKNGKIFVRWTDEKGVRRKATCESIGEARRIRKQTRVGSVVKHEDFLNYNPYTGHITKRGRRAETAQPNGYLRVTADVDGVRKNVAAHRYAFFFMNGRWPVGVVDHINGVKEDNRWVNLRETTNRENLANVAFRERRNVVRLNGKYYPLVTSGFDCPYEAALVADALS